MSGYSSIGPSTNGMIRGHNPGAVAAIRAVVVVAQRSRSVGSGVRRRDVSKSYSESTSGAAVAGVKRRDGRTKGWYTEQGPIPTHPNAGDRSRRPSGVTGTLARSYTHPMRVGREKG